MLRWISGTIEVVVKGALRFLCKSDKRWKDEMVVKCPCKYLGKKMDVVVKEAHKCVC